jgi:hypothetical protein
MSSLRAWCEVIQTEGSDELSCGISTEHAMSFETRKVNCGVEDVNST